MYIKSPIAEVQFFQDLSFLKDVVEYEEAAYLPAPEGYRLPVFSSATHQARRRELGWRCQCLDSLLSGFTCNGKHVNLW